MGKFRRGSEDLLDYPKPLEKEEQLRLLKLAKAGDENALWKVVLHNMRLATCILNGLRVDDDSYADMVQDCVFTLVACVKGIHEDRLEEWPKYIGVCLRHQHWRELKKANKRANKREPFTSEAEEIYERPSEYDVPLEYNGQARRARELLEQLPVGWKRAIELRCLGMSYPEIGKEMGISGSMASSRVRRGMVALKMGMGVGGKGTFKR